jgi:hypothetical protein
VKALIISFLITVLMMRAFSGTLWFFLIPLTATPLAPSLPPPAITQDVRKVKRKWLPAVVFADTHLSSFLLWVEALRCQLVTVLWKVDVELLLFMPTIR